MRLTPAFSSNRMVREYVQSYYLPMAGSVTERCADGGAVAKAISDWSEHLHDLWSAIHFGSLMAGSDDREHRVTIQVYLDGIDPDDVRVQLYADPLEGPEPECHDMVRGQALAGAVNGYVYEMILPPTRPLGHYTVRVVPDHPHAKIPLENHLILWQR